MKVRAKQDCFHLGHRRRLGTVFSVPDGSELLPWMEKVEPDAPEGGPKRVEKTKPMALSEFAKETSKVRQNMPLPKEKDQ